MKQLFFLFLLFFYSCSNAQVLNIRMDSCKYQAVSSRVQNRIVSIQTRNDTTHFVIGLVLSNCNIDSTYDIFHNWKSEDTLDIMVDQQNQITSCRCYFELELDVKRKSNNDLVITSGELVLELSPHYWKVVPVEYNIYQGDTINYCDLYGFKQREHISFDADSNATSITYYQNSVPIWDADYGEEGQLILISYYGLKRTYRDINKNRLKRLIRKQEKKIKKNYKHNTK